MKELYLVIQQDEGTDYGGWKHEYIVFATADFQIARDFCNEMNVKIGLDDPKHKRRFRYRISELVADERDAQEIVRETLGKYEDECIIGLYDVKESED